MDPSPVFPLLDLGVCRSMPFTNWRIQGANWTGKPWEHYTRSHGAGPKRDQSRKGMVGELDKDYQRISAWKLGPKCPYFFLYKCSHYSFIFIPSTCSLKVGPSTQPLIHQSDSPKPRLYHVELRHCKLMDPPNPLGWFDMVWLWFDCKVVYIDLQLNRVWCMDVYGS